MDTSQSVATIETKRSGLTCGISEQRALAGRLVSELDQLESAISILVDAFATMRAGLADIDRTTH